MPLDLSRFGIDPVHGFVAAVDPPAALPPGFAEWDRLAADMPALIRSGQLRGVLERLPVLDPSGLPDDPARERAMLILSVAANAHVHGGAEPAMRLPAGVAVPLCALAATLDRVPIVTHASMVLQNWRRIDPGAPLSADNAETRVDFLGGADERWFFIATLGVELAGAPALPVLAGLGDRVAGGDDAGLQADLERVAAAARAMRGALARMGEWCAPWVFYHRIRPFLAGWPAPGLVYEGVDDAPRMCLGGSAAQSTLIQAFDAGLGVRHTRPETAGFLHEMRRYMPAPHRAFLAALEAGPDLRAHVAAAGRPGLTAAHDACLQALGDLRRDHMAMAARYITAQAPRAGDAALGTGGTEFVGFLRAARDETLAQRLDPA
jgi:indoleamine 2,3-dioxygenase